MKKPASLPQMKAVLTAAFLKRQANSRCIIKHTAYEYQIHLAQLDKNTLIGLYQSELFTASVAGQKHVNGLINRMTSHDGFLGNKAF